MSSQARVRLSLAQPGFVVPLGLVLLLLAWHIASLPLDDLVLPGPVGVIRSLGELLASGELWAALVESGRTFLLGFVVAMLVGLPIGILMGMNRWVGRFGGLYVTIFWATPSIALLPLLIKWFGLSETTKLVIVLLSAVFPIIINTRVGIQQVGAPYREMARSFGANHWEVLRHVLLPGAVPYIVAGSQIAVGRAVIGVVVAELFTSVSGLGAVMTKYSNFFQMPRYFAGLVTFVLFSMLVTGLVEYISSRVVERERQPRRSRQ
jgi:NitT/TauT family transport system permease protein